MITKIIIEPISRWLGQRNRRAVPMAWTRHSSAEMRSGRYAIIDDPHDPEVQVLVDGSAVVPGFGDLERGTAVVRSASQEAWA